MSTTKFKYEPTIYELNKSPVEFLETMPVPEFHINDLSFKNQPLDKALRYYRRIKLSDISEMADIIRKMNDYIIDRRRYQYVDVKVATTGTGHWHLDSALEPVHYFENYLYIAGQPLTEFASNPIIIGRHTNSKTFDEEVSRQIKETFCIPERTITRYWGDNLHRGPKSSDARLLIRLINTDKKVTSYIFNKELARF